MFKYRHSILMLLYIQSCTTNIYLVLLYSVSRLSSIMAETLSLRVFDWALVQGDERGLIVVERPNEIWCTLCTGMCFDEVLKVQNHFRRVHSLSVQQRDSQPGEDGPRLVVTGPIYTRLTRPYSALEDYRTSDQVAPHRELFRPRSEYEIVQMTLQEQAIYRGIQSRVEELNEAAVAARRPRGEYIQGGSFGIRRTPMVTRSQDLFPDPCRKLPTNAIQPAQATNRRCRAPHWILPCEEEVWD